MPSKSRKWPRPYQMFDALGSFVAEVPPNKCGRDGYNALALAYTLTRTEFIIHIAGENGVPASKFEFLTGILRKAKTLLPRRPVGRKRCIKLDDLRDEALYKFFLDLIKIFFPQFISALWRYAHSLMDVNEHMLNLDANEPPFRKLSEWFFVVRRTITTLYELNLRGQHILEILNDAMLLKLWIITVNQLYVCTEEDWEMINRFFPITPSCGSVREQFNKVSEWFMCALLLEQAVRHKHTRKMLSKKVSVVGVGAPSYKRSSRAGGRLLDSCALILAGDLARTSEGFLATKYLLYLASTSHPEGCSLHAEMKLLGYFRQRQRRCSRIVYLKRPCAACLSMLTLFLSKEELHEQRLAKIAQLEDPQSWLIPVPGRNTTTLRRYCTNLAYLLCKERQERKLERQLRRQRSTPLGSAEYCQILSTLIGQNI